MATRGPLGAIKWQKVIKYAGEWLVEEAGQFFAVPFPLVSYWRPCSLALYNLIYAKL